MLIADNRLNSIDNELLFEEGDVLEPEEDLEAPSDAQVRTAQQITVLSNCLDPRMGAKR